jgi:hypothetical protein
VTLDPGIVAEPAVVIRIRGRSKFVVELSDDQTELGSKRLRCTIKAFLPRG